MAYDSWGCDSQCAVNHVGTAPWYRVATPKVGLWSSNVPNEFKHVLEQHDPGTSGNIDDTLFYRLNCLGDTCDNVRCFSDGKPSCVREEKGLCCAEG